MATVLVEQKYHCNNCNKMLDLKQFYKLKSGEPADLCKKCMTLHIDNFDESTYVWLLQKMDVPYLPSEWISLRNKAFAKNPNLTGMSVFGKYLSKMQLNQFKGCGWADTERLLAERGEKARIAKEEEEEADRFIKEQFDNGEISEAEYKTLVSTRAQYEEYRNAPPASMAQAIGENNAYNENDFISESLLPKIELTEDEKIRLVLDWGRLYSENELVTLESNYEELISSLEEDTPDSRRNLRFLCKTYLKMDQSIDSGDFETYQKLAKVSDSIRKSCKLTAAQKKEKKDNVLQTAGVIIAYCEKSRGKIPEHKVDVALDIVDTVLLDNRRYLEKLVKEDTGLARQIEMYIEQKNNIAKEDELDRERDTNNGNVELTDADWGEYHTAIENDYLEDENIWEHYAYNDAIVEEVEEEEDGTREKP